MKGRREAGRGRSGAGRRGCRGERSGWRAKMRGERAVGEGDSGSSSEKIKATSAHCVGPINVLQNAGARE